MIKKLIQKLKGRDAEIYCFFADPGRETLKYRNNAQMYAMIELLDRGGLDYKIVYKRREWFKTTIRVFVLIVFILMISGLLFFDQNIYWKSLYLFNIIYYSVNFKRFVIIADYWKEKRCLTKTR